MINIPAKAALKKVLICVLLGGHLTACSHQTINIKSLFNSNDCAIGQQQLSVLDSQQALDTLLTSMSRRFLNTTPPKVMADFHQQTLILFALGQKNSAGYAIQLRQNHAQVKDEILYLPVHITQPKKSTLQAQVITSPCTIFSVPKTNVKQVQLETES